MTFILKIKDRYYYNRWVPDFIRQFDPRKNIRVSLKTDSRELARKKAMIYNEQIEAYWKELIALGGKSRGSSFPKSLEPAWGWTRVSALIGMSDGNALDDI